MPRYGLVGTGHWAATTHAPALARRPDGPFVAVWGRDPDKAATVAEPHGARVVDDVEELFAEVDVVAFAVPPDVQAPLAVSAARAGCHLLLEKPIALDLGAADELVAAVEGAGVSTVVFFTARFDPGVVAWLDSARAAGEWLGGRATWFGSNYGPGSTYASSAWRRREGGLWDVGPHALALLLPLLGPVSDVTAVPGPGDVTHLVLWHEGGATSTVSLGLTLPREAARVDTAVYGTAGWSLLPDGAPDAVACLDRALGELVASSVTGFAHPCDVRLGREVVDVLARAVAALSDR